MYICTCTCRYSISPKASKPVTSGLCDKMSYLIRGTAEHEAWNICPQFNKTYKPVYKTFTEYNTADNNFFWVFDF